MRVVGVFLVVLGVGLIVLSGCTKPNEHVEPPYYVSTPMPDEAAELVALYLSGEILAPAGLYERVHKELDQLRNEYPAEEAKIQLEQFNLAFAPSVIGCQVDSQTFAAIAQETYTSWDSLNDVYQLKSVTPYHNPGMSYYLFLRFEGRQHPRWLAEAYRTLPGFLMTWGESGGPNLGCVPSFFPRMSENTITYLATNYPWGGDCGYDEFWYYASSGGGVGFFGYWNRRDREDPPRWWLEAEKNIDAWVQWIDSM